MAPPAVAGIAAIQAVAALAAVGISAYSAYSQGKSQQEMANYNSKMAQLQGQREQEAASAKADLYRKDADRRLATVRANYLASGVVGGEGTPLLTLMESAQEAAKNEVRIRRQGEMTSWGLLSEANLSKMKGRSAYTQGLMGAGSSLLSGASRAYGAYSSSGGAKFKDTYGYHLTSEEQ